MLKLSAFLCITLLLSSCATVSKSSLEQGPEYYASLSEEQAEKELNAVLGEIEKIDEEIQSAENRVNSARVQQSSDASKEGAVEGAMAELEAVQARKGQLLNAQVQLEKRLRDFQTNKY